MLKKYSLISLLFCLAILVFTSQLLAADLWTENWEENPSADWYAESGTWEMGAPNSGPISAYSGENCAATILDGNYPTYTSSRLIRIAPFTIPAAGQNPRLRFQHWYSFATYSSGQVQIKVDGGSWEPISPTYSGTGGGIWTKPYIGLSAYAGQSVQIAFYFSSGQYSGVGWYIDDVAVIYGEVVFNEFEDWESGMGDWYPETGTWEAGVPTSGPESAYSPENCAATILAGNYPTYTSSKLISPYFVVADADKNPHLRFQHWYSFATYSSGQVQIKVDGGSWEPISPTYSGTGGGIWTKPYIGLSAYAGQSVQIAFYFSSGQYSGVGWYIDDVEISYDTTIPAQERAALIALYSSTEGDGWDDNSGWKTPPLDEDGFAMPGTECDWSGVDCDGRNTTVEMILLDSNHLNGSLPSELGNLSNLSSLYLYDNQLRGCIPVSLGNCYELLYLRIDDNELSGEIPLELMNLTNLENNSSDFRYNHLYSTNTDLTNFLNQKQDGGDWETSQTFDTNIPMIEPSSNCGIYTSGNCFESFKDAFAFSTSPTVVLVGEGEYQENVTIENGFTLELTWAHDFSCDPPTGPVIIAGPVPTD